MTANVQATMPKVNFLLDSILDRNVLRRPDGRPLYAYRVNSAELEGLRTALAARIKLAARFRGVEETAAFCLFGAECFRRHYAGGPYSWDVIFEQLGCNNRTTQHLKKTVREVADDGLRWWKLDVIRSAHDSQFRLKTLACHGGFPHHVLSNNGAILRRYLCDILRAFEQYDQPISEVVASMNGLLPETINQPVVHDLAATLVSSLAELRRKSEDAKEKGLSRRDYLDQVAPGWATGLPLIVIDESAQEILLSLLDTQRVYTSERKPFAIRTSLRLTGKQAELVRQLHFPQRASIDGFRHSLGIGADREIPSRMSGYLVAGQRSEHCMSIVRFSDGKSLQLRPMGNASVVIESQTTDVRLSLESGIDQVASVAVPGGEALPASPWVFQDGDSGDWVGDGSLRTRHTSVIVAVPADAATDASGAETFETLDQTLWDRKLVQVSGRLSITIGDSLFRIQTHSQDVSELSFELCGSNRHLGLGGQVVWVGPPSVRCTNTSDPEALPTSVHENAIQWRPRGGGPWRQMSDQCVGDVAIRVVEDGSTRFLADATVFPSSFSFRVSPGKQKGSIRLNDVAAKAIYVARDEHVTPTCTQHGDDWEIGISVPGKRPATIKTKIDFESGGVAETSFVCPTEVCSIVDASGEEVDSNRAIPLDRLDGLRLQIVDPRDRAGFLYSMEEMLLVDQLRPTEIKGVSQLPLSLIQNAAKELLGKSRQNDVEVQFGLFYRGDLKAHFKFGVKRYSRELKQQREHSLTDQNIIQIFLDRSDSDPKLNDLVVAPIADPFSDSCRGVVNSDGERTWNVEVERLAPGGYLCHIENRGRETIRPLLVTIKRDEIPQVDFEDVPFEDQFAAVCNMTDHVNRPAAWDRLVTMMVANPAHPAWVTLEALIASSQEMPITTFESIVTIAKHPAAIARIGMQNPGKARWWDRFEELPFLWSLVPIGTWITTAKQVIAAAKETLSSAGVAQSIIDQNVQNRIDDFAKNAPLRCPSLSCVVALMSAARLPINEKVVLECMECTQLIHLENERANMVASLERIDQHVRWPELPLEVTDFVQGKLDEIKGLQTTEMMAYQLPVWNAPAVAAVHNVYDIPTTNRQLATFRTLRSFNLPWYESANRIAVHLLAQRRFGSDKEWADSLREA